MWSLRQKSNGSFYLTFDSQRRYTNRLRGTWELIGPQENEHTSYVRSVNTHYGYLCVDDDEGGVRVLVLED